MSTELLFTLLVGGVVFRRRPDPRTRVAFVAMAVGLGMFLALAAPRAASANCWRVWTSCWCRSP